MAVSRPIRIYVSSTSIDLRDVRKAAIGAIKRFGPRRFELACMEEYDTEEAPPVEKCLNDVAGCDVYVGLFAWRYGYVVPDFGLSITELEYREAVEGGKTLLLYLGTENATAGGYVDDPARVRRLRDELRAQHTIPDDAFFTRPDDLVLRLTPRLAVLEPPARSPARKQFFVFLAAPGGAAARDALAEAVATVQRRVADLAVRVRPIRWPFLDGDGPERLHPADAVRRGHLPPGRCDACLFAVGDTLGEPLPPTADPGDLGARATGEWAVRHALRAAARTEPARPALVVFRRDDLPRIDDNADDAFDQLARRKEVGALARDLVATAPAGTLRPWNAATDLAEEAAGWLEGVLRGDGRFVPVAAPDAVGGLHDPVARALSVGFLTALRDLADLGATALGPRRARLEKWLAEADAPRQCERALAGAVVRTVAEPGDAAERALAYLNDAVGNPAVPKLVAATALEMVRAEAAVLPAFLIEQMQVREAHVELLGQFLHRLRGQLAHDPAFVEPIACANDLAGLGLLAGFAGRIAASLDRIARIQAYLAFEFKARRLTDNARDALDGYLAHLRDFQLTYSPLPLVRAGTQDRAGARIKDIFVPVALRGKEAEKAGRKPKPRRPAGAGDAAPPQGDADLGGLLLAERKLVLLGPPGGGKTTLLKRAALALAEGRGEDVPGWKGATGAVPIFLRLRSFAAFLQANAARFIEPCPASLVAYLEHYYREEQRLALTPDFFDRLLADGGCAVFMDGLDEVPVAQRAEVARHVAEFVARYDRPRDADVATGPGRLGGNLFVLTSRPKGYEPVEFYLRPAQFAVHEVKPLEPAGIRQLVTNLLAFIEQDPRQQAQDFKGLCAAIFRATDLALLAGTPLFCTSLVLVYKYHGAELPQRRIDVFEEIVDLLLGFWKAQDQKVVQAGRGDDDEGLNPAVIDLGTAVKIKKRRLGHIALQMQLSEKRTEIDFVTLAGLLADYLAEKERAPRDQAAAIAERFLVVSHERSGLLVETEPSDPPIYAFTHEGFREYLVADALANLREAKFIGTVLDNIDNPTWEEVLLLAGAHPGLSDDLREYLLEECLAAATKCKAAGNLDGWVRRLTMVGRMARDMGEYLSPKDRTKLKELLAEAMLDPANQLKFRIEIALVLDLLGWLTTSLFACVAIPAGAGRPTFHVGKHLVANGQYERFLNAADLEDPSLWDRPFCVGPAGRPYSLCEESLHWLRVNGGDKRLPKSWNDPKFGIAHRGLPVVGVNWYEANAYCRWLERHWDELDEARANPDLRPGRVRLPTEAEWCLALFAGEAGRYPWQRGGEARPDLLAHANLGKALDRTSPLGMFPRGSSQPHGLVDPFGNAWEWQANQYRATFRGVALRGGAYSTPLDAVAPDLRGWRDPAGRDNDLGFRILVEPAAGDT